MDQGVTEIRIGRLRFYPGARFGLDEKTALLDLTYGGTIADLADFDRALSTLLEELRPPEARPLRWPAEPRATDAPIGGNTVATALAWRIIDLLVLMQRWAMMAVFHGKVLRASPGQLQLALPWVQEPALRGGLQLAIRLILLAGGNGPQSLKKDLRHAFAEWLEATQTAGLAPLMFRLADAAHRKGSPIERRNGFLQLGWGANAKRLTNTITSGTSAIAVRVARRKHLANRVLAEAGLPVPLSRRVASAEQALEAAERIGWPVVVKPADKEGGVAVTTNIRDPELLGRAFAAANVESPGAVIVERHIPGDDHRLLVVGGRMLIATKRTAAGVTGDGIRTVSELLEALNADPLRGQDKLRNLLIRIRIDEEALQCLKDQGLGLESVPEPGQFVRLRLAANIGIGGTAEDVTECVHPDNRRMAIRAARVIGLDVAGIDFLCPDISKSWSEVGGGICEVNAQPALRVHWLGDPERDLEGEIIDWLTAGHPTRIPVAAIAGADGKSTTARMLHHIWMAAGKTPGLCTAYGTYVGDEVVSAVDLSGFRGARLLFNDPAVEVAVVELPSASVIQFGHPCDRYDVAALLNSQNDDSAEETADLEAEALERARFAVVINADDPLCLAMRTRAGCPRHILVSCDASAPALREHLAAGGEGVFAQAREGAPWIVLAKGAEQSPLMSLAEIPATTDGLPRSNDYSAMFAVALAWAQGVPLETIRQALPTFTNPPKQSLGR